MLILLGFIVGLGATTVIDCISLLGARSAHWTQTAIRAHKVTKPLIISGAILKTMGEVHLYLLIDYPLFHLEVWLNSILLINACLLVFWASPYLLRKEKQNQDLEILPVSFLRIVIPSFIVSFVVWWTSFALFALTLIYLIQK